MDSADKEIAALSSPNASSKLVAQIGTAPSQQETLLNKVSIENDDSIIENRDGNYPSMIEKPSANMAFQLQARSFGLSNQQLNQSWPLAPLKSSFMPTDSASSQHQQVYQKLPNGNSLLASSTDQANGYVSNVNESGGVDLNSNVNELKQLLVQMTQTLRMQNDEIENLKKHQVTSQNQLKSHIDTVFNKLSKHQTNSIHSNQIAPLISDETQLNNLIQQSLNKHLQPKLEKVFKDEVNKAIQIQLSSKLLEPMREQITRDLATQLKSVEGALKDSVSKMFKSKSTLDSLSQSIVSSQQATIINSYRDTFQKVIVPNFEKSCQNMYQQVNSSFSKGTQDYLIEFDTLAKQHSKKFEESKEPILAQMNKFNEQMAGQSTQMANILASNLQQQFEANLRNTNAILQDTIISSVKAIIKEEIQLAMRDQQQSLPEYLVTHFRQSGTMTPMNLPGTNNTSEANSVDIQYQITQLLKKGHVNAAFQQALCAADLNLLENLCDIISPSQAFDPNNSKKEAKLQQPVILSLIQQLSQELTSNTDMKVKYLEEAIVNLDMSIPLTIEHSPSVINQLMSSLSQYIQTRQNDKWVRTMRMLLLASKSLLQSQKQASSQKSQLINGASMSQSMSNNTLATNGNNLPGSVGNGNFQVLSNQLKKNFIQQQQPDQYQS